MTDVLFEFLAIVVLLLDPEDLGDPIEFLPHAVNLIILIMLHVLANAKLFANVNEGVLTTEVCVAECLNNSETVTRERMVRSATTKNGLSHEIIILRSSVALHLLKYLRLPIQELPLFCQQLLGLHPNTFLFHRLCFSL